MLWIVAWYGTTMHGLVVGWPTCHHNVHKLQLKKLLYSELKWCWSHTSWSASTPLEYNVDAAVTTRIIAQNDRTNVWNNFHIQCKHCLCYLLCIYVHKPYIGFNFKHVVYVHSATWSDDIYYTFSALLVCTYIGALLIEWHAF